MVHVIAFLSTKNYGKHEMSIDARATYMGGILFCDCFGVRIVTRYDTLTLYD